jgi:hypothetical protein
MSSICGGVGKRSLSFNNVLIKLTNMFSFTMSICEVKLMKKAIGMIARNGILVTRQMIRTRY